MPYSEVKDMLTGPIPLPRSLDPEKYVQDAADEIDTQLGFTYETPIVAVEGAVLPKPVSLLLKRINNLIASGRVIMAAAGPSQDTAVNAYGRSLVVEGQAALASIAKGAIVLEGAVRLPSDSLEMQGPRITNAETGSNVDAFYGHYTPAGGMMFDTSFPRLGGVSG